jgi:hypothetical protein
MTRLAAGFRFYGMGVFVGVPAGPAFIPSDADKAESAGRESMDVSLGKASESGRSKPRG